METTINPFIIYLLFTLIALCVIFLLKDKIILVLKNLFDYLFIEQKELITGEVIEISKSIEPEILPLESLDLSSPPTVLLPNDPVRRISIKKNDGQIVFVRISERVIKKLHIEAKKIISDLKCSKYKYQNVYSYDYT